jgi:hypothetical protein
MGGRPTASGRLAEEAERVARALNDSLPALPAAAEEAPAAEQPAAQPPPAEPPPEQPPADAAQRTRAFSGEEYMALADELARQRARAEEEDAAYRATVLPSKKDKDKVDLRALAAQARAEMRAKKQAQERPPAAPPAQQPAQGEPSAPPPVEGQERARGERLRAASVVVLDEARDDPALRFVLVAVALFLLFLLILLLSHMLD